MFSLNQRRRSSSAARRSRRVSRLEQLEARTLLTSWVGQIGGVGYDSVQSQAVMDTAGNMYLGGVYSATADFELGPGATTLTTAGAEDAYVAKYAPDGSLLWVRQFGGSQGDHSASIRLDPATGSLFVTGAFRGAADFTGDGVADLTSAGNADVFVVRLDPVTGNTLWHKRIGGANDETANDGAAADGHVYVVGLFSNTVDFNPGTGTNSLTSTPLTGKGSGKNYSRDGYLLKLTDQGNYVWAGQISGQSDESDQQRDRRWRNALCGRPFQRHCRLESIGHRDNTYQQRRP